MPITKRLYQLNRQDNMEISNNQKNNKFNRERKLYKISWELVSLHNGQNAENADNGHFRRYFMWCETFSVISFL